MSRLLVVDDNEQNLYMLRVLLEAHGYEVQTAVDGAQALEFARREPPFLIIADILMPVMDGFTLCREWQTDAVLAGVPFVFYTATYTDPKDEAFALSLGAARFIVKPVEPDEFVDILRDVISAHEHRRLAATREPVANETVYLREYNAALVRKLEDKLLQVEEANSALAREVDERKKAQVVLRRRNRISEAAAAASLRYLETGDTRDMAAIVVEQAIAVTGASFGFACDLDPTGAPRVLASSVSAPPATEAGSLRPEALDDLGGQGALWWVEGPLFTPLHERLTVMTNNASDDAGWSALAPAGHPVIDSFLGVPMMVANAVIGMVAVANRPGGFADRQQNDIEVLANTAALALRMARSEERRLEVEAQLHHAQKMEAVGRLAGGIAHDFNNVLAAIAGNAELASLEPALPTEVAANLSEISNATFKAADLTRRLLAFSRRQPLSLRLVDLNRVLANLETMLRRLIGKGIELTIRPADNAGIVRVDGSQIEQAIINLAINARDAMPRGGRLIIETADVRLDEEYAAINPGAAPGDYVMLTVSDTGCGMTDAVKSHVFEPFFTTKGATDGTGLGLATCYAVVKQSGGSIWLYSEIGIGTTFRIYLPRVEGDVGEVGRAAEGGDLPRGTETILLVEDDAAVRRVAASMLRDLGYTVLEAAGGHEALERVRSVPRVPIGLLLTDVVMPGLGGLELAERIASLRPDAKILLMSGYADLAFAASGTGQGLALLQKPFDRRSLAQKVRSVFES